MKHRHRAQFRAAYYATVGLIIALPPAVTANPPGFTSLQANTADTIADVCDGFSANGTNTSLEAALFGTCLSMVNNSNELVGSSFDSTSRGLSESELAAGYQNLATEESLSPVRIGTNATTGQALTIITRTQQLRGAGGFAYNPYLKGSIAGGLVPNLSGGNAGDSDSIAGKFSAFLTPFGGFGDTASTSQTAGTDFYNVGFTAGIDYRITENLIFGLAGGYSHLDLDYLQTGNVAGGNVDGDTGSFSAYGTYYRGDFYIDTLFNYGWTNYQLDRRVVIPSNNLSIPGSMPVDGSARSETDGTQWTFSFQTGYDFHFDGLSFGPYIKANYIRVHTDAYTETGAGALNLLVHEQDTESVQSVLGGQIRYASSQSFGVILPYLRFDWVHEFRDSGRTLTAQFVNDPRNNLLVASSNRPDRNFFNLNTGVSAVLQHGIQAYFNYNTILAHDLISGHLFSVGARMEF